MTVDESGERPTQYQEPSLNPVPLPMPPPPDGCAEVESLVGVLDADADPVIPVPSSDESFDERDAEKLTEDHEQVRSSKDEDVASDQSSEFPR